MRSKVFVIGLMFCAALFSLGCGGGGGDSGSGVTPTTNPTLSGSLDKPVATVDGWAASIRPLFQFAKLTATAYGQAGTSLGSAQLNDAGAFTITLTTTADNEVTIKVTSSVTGFEMSYLVGKVSGSLSNLTVSATTTCQLLLEKQYALATDTSSVAFTTLYNAFLGYLSGSPTTGSIVDTLKASSVGTTMNTFTTAQSTIKANFVAIENALKAKSITDTVKYFSTSFSVTDTSLGVSLDNFKTTTSDRFTRYTIDSYSFTIEKIIFTGDGTTATVYASASIAVTGITDGSKQSATVPNLQIIMRNEGGSWLVYKDFPYLKSQISSVF